MTLNIVTLANIIKHGDVLLDLLRGGNTPQTIGRLKELAATSTGFAGSPLTQLLAALDGLEQNLRALKLSEPVLANEPPQRGLNLPQWTADHAVVLDDEIMRVRRKVMFHNERVNDGRNRQFDLAASEVYGGLLNTLVAMRKPVE